MWHTRTYFHSLINVCDRFLERTKLSRSAAAGRELFIARLGLGAHGGANGLVPLLPASLCEPDKAIRIALGERHAEKCAMRKTLSGGFWIVSAIKQKQNSIVEYRKDIDVARAFERLERFMVWTVGFGSNQDDGSVLEMVSWMDPLVYHLQGGWQ